LLAVWDPYTREGFYQNCDNSNDSNEDGIVQALPFEGLSFEDDLSGLAVGSEVASEGDGGVEDPVDKDSAASGLLDALEAGVDEDGVDGHDLDHTRVGQERYRYPLEQVQVEATIRHLVVWLSKILLDILRQFDDKHK